MEDASSLVDRISELPHKILGGTILSLLPMKEAEATSIVSKRWCNAWAFTKNLYFDADEILRSLESVKPDQRDQESRRYVNWVNHVVEQHRGSNIEQFRVCFDLDRRFTSSIDKWIQFAKEKKVEVLELYFRVQVHLLFEYTYVFPRVLGGFEFLRVLYLNGVDVTQEVVEDLLSNCPVLERLSVIYGTNLGGLRVVSPPASLKYLFLSWCTYLRSVEICDANLVSFIYEGPPIDLLIRNVPLLVEASLPIGFCPGRSDAYAMDLPFTQLSCCLSQLETLMLDLQLPQTRVFHVPLLPNLKHLKLNVVVDFYGTLTQLYLFLEACPCLEKLVLKMIDYHWEALTIEEGVKFTHQNLKVVEILGYRGNMNAIEHVRYLIQVSVALNKLVIDPVEHRDPFDTGIWKTIEDVKEEEEARDHAMHQLKQIVPSSIDFVCL